MTPLELGTRIKTMLTLEAKLREELTGLAEATQRIEAVLEQVKANRLMAWQLLDLVEGMDNDDPDWWQRGTDEAMDDDEADAE